MTVEERLAAAASSLRDAAQLLAEQSSAPAPLARLTQPRKADR